MGVCRTGVIAGVLVHILEKELTQMRVPCCHSKKCDGFIAASTETVPSIDAVSILHDGPEQYHKHVAKGSQHVGLRVRSLLQRL